MTPETSTVSSFAHASQGVRLRRSWASACALFGYAAVALLFSWPLPLHLSTRLTGRITGDTGTYVWNIWLFRHEIVAHGHFPLLTHEILSLTPPVDLSLHNYTLFANLLAFPLIPLLGVTATFNVIYIAMPALTAWTMFLLARHVCGRSGEAWLTGLLFGFSPVLIARSTAHFSLVAAAPLPLFLFCLLRADAKRTWAHAVAVGAVAAWAAICDPYYGVFCVLIALYYVALHGFTIRADDGRSVERGWGVRAIDGSILAAAALVALLAITGGAELRMGRLVVTMRTLYTPVLVLTALLGIRAVIRLKHRVALDINPSTPGMLRLAAFGALGCLLPLVPVLYAFSRRLSDGGTLQGPVYWRSSPPGVDLLSLLVPNPNHAVLGPAAARWLARQPGGFVENAASLTYVALAVLGLAIWRSRFRPPRLWVGLTVFFGALALGPFVHAATINTFVPGPWALLRYVPLIGATRTPARFAIVLMLGFAMLFGLALAHLADRHPARRRLLLACVAAALVFELSPWPRLLYSAEIPSIYRIIAADPRDVRVLELPFGVRDGERSVGNFTAASQFFQTVHEKRLIGGYLSRVTQRSVERLRESQTLGALIQLSEGRRLDRREALVARGPAFVRRVQLGYVIVDTSRASPALRQYAVDAFDLVKIAESGGRELYVPRADVDQTSAGGGSEGR